MSDRPRDFGDVAGPSGPCHWYKSSAGACSADCNPKDANTPYLGANCEGSPAGAQVCYCEANGVPLNDVAPGETGHGASFYADDCPDVAQKMADGACSKVLNCCFTWMPVPVTGKPSVQQCSCLSDPPRFGYASCEALATQGGGQVVELCPQYVPASGMFPGQP